MARQKVKNFSKSTLDRIRIHFFPDSRIRIRVFLKGLIRLFFKYLIRFFSKIGSDFFLPKIGSVFFVKDRIRVKFTRIRNPGLFRREASLCICLSFSHSHSNWLSFLFAFHYLKSRLNFDYAIKNISILHISDSFFLCIKAILSYHL